MEYLQRHVLPWAGMLSAALLPAGPVSAQPMLPETVVTASRIEEPLGQVGSAITVITRQELENRQVYTVAEALRNVPGVAVSQSGTLGTFTQVRIRGAEANHTLVLIDGVEANDPAFESTFDFAHLLTADIERIEILRGSQSALWGSDAIGGVINIITRRGSGPPRLSASAEGGSYDTYRLGANLSGSGNRFNYYLGATRLQTQGDSVAPGGNEEDGYKNTTLSLKTGATPWDNLTLDLVGRYTTADSETDPQDFSFDPVTGLPGPLFGRVVDGGLESNADQFYGRAQAKLTLLDGLWEHLLGAALTDSDNDFLTDGRITNRTDGRKLKYDYQTNVYLDTAVGAPASHSLTFALEWEKEDFKQRGQTTDAPESQTQDQANKGYIGEYRLGIQERVFLTAALRYDDNDRFANATTYRLTGAYLHPATLTRLHASYGTGVSNPSFTQLFGFFPGVFVGNPQLRPEKSKGWDVGVEQSFLDRRLTLDVTYFRNRFEDEILPTFDLDTGLSSVVNAPGTSRRQGVEVSARARITEALDLTGAYTYTDSEDPEGQAEVRQPKHVASLILDYRFLAARGRLNLGIDYVGDREDFDFTTLPSGRVDLSDYTLVRLSGAYQLTKAVELFGRGENLLDQDYQEVFGYNTLGRTFYLGVKVSSP